ncbi:MAG TPA: potassium channel family protein [Streptosporangiaceae bacterium]|nr:potassium channel family protein [Streptosporangiaceae bacterium]
MAGRGDRGRTGPSRSGGRYGLLLLVLVGTYLLAAFSGATLATQAQVVLYTGVLLIALRTSPMPAPWPALIAVVTVAGSAVTFWTSLSGARTGRATEDLWKALLLLAAAIMVVRRVLAKREVTIQSIYGALSAYLITGLMFASVYTALDHLGEATFFASNQPANTQTFQYFSFTTLTTLGYGDFTAAESGGRSIAVMEALTGQVFLATLVARLVSAYRTPSRPEPAGRDGLPEDVDGPGDDEDRD